MTVEEFYALLVKKRADVALEKALNARFHALCAARGIATAGPPTPGTAKRLPAP